MAEDGFPWGQNSYKIARLVFPTPAVVKDARPLSESYPSRTKKSISTTGAPPSEKSLRAGSHRLSTAQRVNALKARSQPSGNDLRLGTQSMVRTIPRKCSWCYRSDDHAERALQLGSNPLKQTISSQSPRPTLPPPPMLRSTIIARRRPRSATMMAIPTASTKPPPSSISPIRLAGLHLQMPAHIRTRTPPARKSHRSG
jgi:hypothetical protein